VSASVVAPLAIDALQRAITVGATVVREFAAALRNRAADWKSAYAGLAGRIASLAERRSASARDFEAEYAVSSESAD
jgi:hypothetical protein